MADKVVRPWVAVNEYMNDEYRELVVQLALRHWPQASSHLCKFADKFLGYISVPGFRTIRKAPPKLAAQYVAKAFKKRQPVASAIICLWSETQQEIVVELKEKAQAAGIKFNTDWSWEDALAGYYEFEDIPELNRVMEVINDGKEKPERDHFMLAALWLSRAIVDEEDIETRDVPASGDGAGSEGEEPGLPGIEGGEAGDDPAIQPEVGEEPRPQAGSDELAVPIEEPEVEEMPEILPDLGATALNDLCEQWEAQANKVQLVQKSAAQVANDLQDVIRKEQINQSRQLSRQVQDCLDAWEAQWVSYGRFAQVALARVIQEYELRPDLEKPKLITTQTAMEGTFWADFPVQTAKDAIQVILNYDRRKGELEENLNGIREEIVKIQQALLDWQDESGENGPLFTELEEKDEMTLDDLEEIFHQAEALMQTLTSSHMQFRDQSINRTHAHIAKLIEIAPDDQDILINSFTLAALTTEDLLSWTDKDLRLAEETLLAALNERVAQTQRGNSASLAARLKEAWDEQVLAELLGHLAAEKREVEALVLELAATKSHPRNVPNIYSKEAVTNLLNGLGQVSSKTKPYELLGWLAPTFLTGFKGEEDYSQAEICLVALAANISAEHLQPNGYLWQIAQEWPIADMPGWEKLWQYILFEDSVQIFSDQMDDTLRAALADRRKEAEQALARDGAHFIRLGSLQSSRHRSLLGNKLLPVLAEKLTLLKQLDKNLNESEPGRLPIVLGRLRTALNEQIAPELEEASLLKRYETGLHEVGIDETESFYRKISVRILEDCAAGVLNYGAALLEYWELKEARSNGLKSSELQDELNRLSSLTALGQAAFEHIIQSQPKDRIAWNETYANHQSMQHIIQEALTQPSCVIHLPRLVGKLVNQFLDWEAILAEVINDIAEPLALEEAAEYLLEAKAPTQALMLVKYLPLEKQKRAQELRSDFERLMNNMLPELLQLGGGIESISSWHAVGRWGYLLAKMSEDIAILREIQESRSRAVEEKSLEFRQRINNLDIDLFRIKPDLSTGVYDLISHGVAAARRASELEELFPNVEGFLREMSYRLEHRSWQQGELQASVDLLEKAISRSIDPPPVKVTAEQLLECLETGQLEELKLTRNQISDSEINTRIDLLHNWLLVKQLKGLVREDLRLTGTTAIQNLFHYFAQMMAMKKYRLVDGKEIAFIPPPVVYESWQLQFPRTAALDKQCLLIALPSNPPAISDIKYLQEFIEEKEFLDGDFVFLFVPGCDEKVTRRFRGMGDGKGLVLIDEPALVQMLLAEAEASIPLGRLRPMMLDAINANTNIFTVNQTVDARTAIFLGRDRLIDKISRSGGNYPIYGGRRIGKSSLLKAVEQRLGKNVKVVVYTLEGDKDLTDEAVSRQLAEEIGLKSVASNMEEFKPCLFQFMDENPDKSLVIILDEVDRYIQINQQRHNLIETLRAASDRYGNRFRVIIAGFMELFDCLSGRGPYTQTSDPWRRMLDNDGPLGNLTSVNAEAIVKEGFLSILGWKFENRAIPQLIVERTGGHPAFVQEFCLKILEKVRGRGDRMILISDVDAVFNDNDPKRSFIAYVRETLEMNLDTVGRYLVVMLASRPEESMGFTWDEICEIAETSSPPIPKDRLKRSLEYLSVTSVVREVSKQVYEYTVPDYPNILRRLGDTGHLNELEDNLKRELGEG